MYTGNIGQILINPSKGESGAKPVQLTPGQVISVRVKEVTGDTALLSYQGQEIVARLEADIPQGQQLRCLVAGENNGQLVLKVLNSGQEMLTPAAVKNILAMLGLQDDEINRGLIGQMVKMEMPLSRENARQLSAFMHAQKIPLQDVGIPVFIKSQGLPLTSEMFTGVKALFTDINFLSSTLKELLSASSLATGNPEIPGEQKQLLINLSQAIRNMQLDGQDTAETAALKLTNLFYQLTSSGTGRTAGQAIGPVPPQITLVNQEVSGITGDSETSTALSGDNIPDRALRIQGQTRSDSMMLPAQTGPGGQAGQAQIGQAQIGQVQAGQIQTGQVQTGQVQSSQAQMGQVQAGQIQTVQIQTGQVQAGQVQATNPGQTAAILVESPVVQAEHGQPVAAASAQSQRTAVSSAQSQPTAIASAQSQPAAARYGQSLTWTVSSTQRPVAEELPGPKMTAPVNNEVSQAADQAGMPVVRPAGSDIPANQGEAAVSAGTPGGTRNVDPRIIDIIVKRLSEAAQKDPTLDVARKELFITRLRSIVDPSGDEMPSKPDLLPVLNNLVSGLSQKSKHDNNDLLKLAQNVMDKLEMLRSFNTKAEPGRENMLVMYSSVRYEDREEPLSLFVSYRYDGKNKQRDFNSCRMEVKLQTPNLGLVRCEVQVNYKALNLQFTCDNEKACRLVDSVKESLVEKLRQMDYQVTTGASKLDAAKEGQGLWLNDEPDKPGLFKINLRV